MRLFPLFFIAIIHCAPSLALAANFSGRWEGRGLCSTNFSEKEPCDLISTIEQTDESLSITDCTVISNITKKDLYCQKDQYEIRNLNELWLEIGAPEKLRVGTLGAQEIFLKYADQGIKENELYQIQQVGKLKYQNSYEDDSGFSATKNAILIKKP